MLSDAKIRSLKPRKKAYKVSDDRGLYLLVNPNGSCWWRFKSYFDGKERGISLEIYPDVPLKYAREQREDAGSSSHETSTPASSAGRRGSPSRTPSS